MRGGSFDKRLYKGYEHMSAYVVSFRIDIPVVGEQIKDEVDAMYEARDQFCNFNVNEFEKQVTPVSEDKAREMIALIRKMHDYDSRKR